MRSVIKCFISASWFVSYFKDVISPAEVRINWDMVGWWNDEIGEICKEMVSVFWGDSLTFCWRKWEITWRIHNQGNKFISADAWMNGGLFNYPVSNEAVLLHQMMREDNGHNWTWKYGVVANLKVLPQHSHEGTGKITKLPVRRFDAPTNTWSGTSLPSNASQKYYCLSHLTWSKKWVSCSTFHYVCCIRFEAFTADVFTKIILDVSHFIFMIKTDVLEICCASIIRVSVDESLFLSLLAYCLALHWY